MWKVLIFASGSLAGSEIVDDGAGGLALWMTCPLVVVAIPRAMNWERRAGRVAAKSREVDRSAAMVC
jgi:hypothetical protein